MPISAERCAVDTSVAVPALDSAHPDHVACRARVIETGPALAGHAAFETYSVLTRMPGPLRLDGASVVEMLAIAFSERCWLDAEAAEELLRLCGSLGIVGGAVYDAFVGQAALVHRRTLLTRDRRALRTYDLLGVTYEQL